MNDCIVVDNSGMTPEEFSRSRVGRLGATDVVALCGLSTFKGHDAIGVWLSKCRPVDRPATDRQRWGHKLEPLIADEFLERHQSEGYAVTDPRSSFCDREHPFLSTTPDRFYDVGGVRGVLEIKTTQFGSRYARELPSSVLAQVVWNCGILGLSEGVVAALSGGSDYVESETIRLSDYRDVFLRMKDLAINFWRNHVLANEPPPASRIDSEAHLRIFGSLLDEPVEMPDLSSRAFDYVRLKAEIKSLQVDLDQVTAELMLAMGTHGHVLAGDYVCRIRSACRVTKPRSVEKVTNYRFLDVGLSKGG